MLGTSLLYLTQEWRALGCAKPMLHDVYSNTQYVAWLMAMPVHFAYA